MVDLAPAMLALSRRLNPECEHVLGDMRSVRLARAFDCVLAHDAIGYLTSRADLASAVATAFEHTAPGGVALFQPDFVSETFEPGTEVEAVHDRHILGLFPRSTWLELIEATGFEPLAVPFEHSSSADGGRETFLGLRPGKAQAGGRG